MADATLLPCPQCKGRINCVPGSQELLAAIVDRIHWFAPDMEQRDKDNLAASIYRATEAARQPQVPAEDVELAERIGAVIAFNRNKSNFEIAKAILTALQVTEGDKS